MREAAQHFLELPWIDAVRLHHRARDGIAEQLGEGRLGEIGARGISFCLTPDSTVAAGKRLQPRYAANKALSDVQASAYGEKADLITCDITPTSDSFQPSRTHSAGSWLRSIKNEQLVRSAAFHS